MSVMIEVPIPDELVPVLERKALEAGLNRSDYVSVILSRALTEPRSLDTILEAFRAQVASSGITDPELEGLFTEARNQTRE